MCHIVHVKDHYEAFDERNHFIVSGDTYGEVMHEIEEG